MPEITVEFSLKESMKIHRKNVAVEAEVEAKSDNQLGLILS